MYVFMYKIDEYNKKIICEVALNQDAKVYFVDNLVDLDKIYQESNKKNLLIINDRDYYDLKSIKKFNNETEILVLSDFKNVEFISKGINNKNFNYIVKSPIGSKKEIQNIIKKVINKNKEIKEITRQNLNDQKTFKDMVTMEYIYDLIYGRESRINENADIDLFRNINKNYTTLIFIKIDDFWYICDRLDNKKRYIVKRRSLEIIRKCKVEGLNFIATSLIGTDKLILLVENTHNKKDQTLEVKLAKKIINKIKKQSNYTATAAVSRRYSGIKEIWKAYEEAFQALLKSFSLGKESIILCSEIESDVGKKIYNEYNLLEFKIIKSFSKPKIDDVYFEFNNYCGSLKNNENSENTIKAYLIRLIFNITQYVNQSISEEEISVKAIEASNNILKSNSLEKIKEISKEFLRFAHYKMIKNLSKDKNNIFYNVKAFIEKFYYTNLTLDEIAKVASFSPSYFSRKFKLIFGVSFIEYLNDYRLMKSKELLENTELTVGEIAQKVGFSEYTYFSKLFKSKYNKSPSYFKNK